MQLNEVVEASAEALEVARAHLGLRRSPGLRVRVGDGRAFVASRGDASCDAVLIDAFVGARVPRHLVDAAALADVRRVVGPSGVAAINVVDAAGLPDTRRIAAGLLASFPVVIALAPTPVLRGKRSGNVVLMASSNPLPEDHLRTRAAADVSPAALATTADLTALATTPY